VSTVLVYPPASGIGRTTTVTRTLRPLTPAAAERVVADLAAGGIHVAAHLGPLTTIQEVRVIAAFTAVTDGRLDLRSAVTTVNAAKILPNGNIEITVQLMPAAYAALAAAMERDGLTRVDVVNLAVLTLDHVTKAAADAGKPLREALDDE
jgi:hypothetical protein